MSSVIQNTQLFLRQPNFPPSKVGLPVADPITPFENAQLMIQLLGESAVLVKQDGFGHTSLGEMSSCTYGLINTYLTNGSLPENNDTLCEIDADVVLFPNSPVTHADIATLQSMIAAVDV
ncbi:hypothetical protein K523DRAFT_421331 [Schizophyllum commune Tattone D]|nr:hypothetical protein K523DRAFT_421331 [Schizophyllum commune Tattone D]